MFFSGTKRKVEEEDTIVLVLFEKEWVIKKGFFMLNNSLQ